MISESHTRKASQRVRGDQARARILAAAAEAFARGGYNGSSIEQIARAAGLTKPGLLHHFPSKIGLLRAVLDQRSDDAIVEAGVDNKTLGVLDTVFKVAHRDVSDTVRTRGYAVLLGEAIALDAPFADRFRQHYASVTQEVTDAIRSAMEDGSARADADPEGIAAEVIAVMDGLQAQWLLGGDPELYLSRLHSYLTRLRDHLETIIS